MTSNLPGNGAAAAVLPGAQPIRVLFCCNPGFYQHLAVALASLLVNNQQRSLDVTIIASAEDAAAERKLLSVLPEHPDAKVTLRHFALDGFNALPTSGHITAEAYLRILAIDMLPSECTKVLYLDCDLVVVTALDDLWETDISGHALAAAPDPFDLERPGALGMPEGTTYVNSGVLLINVRRWREGNLTARLIAYAEHEGSRLTLHDQDAINAILHAEILVLSYRWNCQARMFQAGRWLREREQAAVAVGTRDPAIIHFTTPQKPWIFTSMVPCRSLYRRYLALTAWRGAPRTRRSIAHMPEALYNRIAYLLESPHDYERFLRSTNAGRVLVRSGQLMHWAASFLRRRTQSAAGQRQSGSPQAHDDGLGTGTGTGASGAPQIKAGSLGKPASADSATTFAAGHGASQEPQRTAKVEGDPIRVLFCCNPGYYQHLAVALASLLKNNQRRALDITVVASAKDDEAERKLLSVLPAHPGAKVTVRHFGLEKFHALHTSAHITTEAYLRILVLDTLPAECERLIYLDCDLVVLEALDELWATDMGGYALAAVPDIYGTERPKALGMPDGAAYVNSGVLLINVAQWRKQNLTARIISYAEAEGSRLQYHDQDAINAVLSDQILALPLRWNCQARMFRFTKSLAEPDRAAVHAATSDPAIIHYTTAQKPWMFTAFMPKRAVYRRYLAMTAWHDTPMTRRSLGYLPEALFNCVGYALGATMTYERFLRATNAGRVLVHSAEAVRWGASLRPTGAWSALRRRVATIMPSGRQPAVSGAESSRRAPSNGDAGIVRRDAP